MQQRDQHNYYWTNDVIYIAAHMVCSTGGTKDCGRVQYMQYTCVVPFPIKICQSDLLQFYLRKMMLPWQGRLGNFFRYMRLLSFPLTNNDKLCYNNMNKGTPHWCLGPTLALVQHPLTCLSPVTFILLLFIEFYESCNSKIKIWIGNVA